jgi:tetratricopeptide (TPR) repeat protein
MNSEVDAPLVRAKSKLPLLRIAYTEFQYWCIGLTPENYHWSQGSSWEECGDYPRAVKHLNQYLKYKENAYARALLAYCYSRLSAWDDVVREYTAVLAAWPHPSFMLGLAEALLHLGHLQQARALTDEVESKHHSQESPVAGLDDMKQQLYEASIKLVQAT